MWRVMPIPTKIFRTYFSGFTGIIPVAFFFVWVFSSCMISENYGNVDRDGEIKQIVYEISFGVDSLVWAGHPDPVVFLDSAAQASPEPEIEDLFGKYTGISYYFLNTVKIIHSPKPMRTAPCDCSKKDVTTWTT